jgi:hypothetical protein
MLPAGAYVHALRHAVRRRLIEIIEDVVAEVAGDERDKLGRIGPGGGKRVHGWDGRRSHDGIGWDVAYVAVDATRLAYAEKLPDELGQSAALLERVLAFFAGHGSASSG